MNQENIKIEDGFGVTVAVVRPRNITFGAKIIWAIPATMKPLKDFPEGKIRLRFRQKKEGLAFVLTADGIRQFVIEDKGDHWAPLFETGRNYRPNRQS